MGFFGYVVCPCKAPFHFDFGGWRKKRQFFFIPEFLRLRTLVSWPGWFFIVRGCPVHGTCHSAPGLYPLEASSTLLRPSDDTQQCLQTWPMSPEGQQQPGLGTMALTPSTPFVFTSWKCCVLFLLRCKWKSVYGFLCVELGWKRFHRRSPHFSSVVASASAQWWKYPLATSHLPSGLLSATR